MRSLVLLILLACRTLVSAKELPRSELENQLVTVLAFTRELQEREERKYSKGIKKYVKPATNAYKFLVKQKLDCTQEELLDKL